MNKFLSKVRSFFKSLFTKSKKVVARPQQTEEYEGWLGV